MTQRRSHDVGVVCVHHGIRKEADKGSVRVKTMGCPLLKSDFLWLWFGLHSVLYGEIRERVYTIVFFFFFQR